MARQQVPCDHSHRASDERSLPVWDALTIGEIAKFTSGAPIDMSTLSEWSPDRSIPVYGGNGIAGYSDRSNVDGPTVVIGRVGQKCGAVYYSVGPAWVTDNALYPVQVYKPCDMKFLSLTLQRANLNGSRNRNDLPLITQEILRRIEVPWLHSPEGQERVTAALSDVAALVASLDRVISKKRAIKIAVMQSRLTPSDSSAIGEYSSLGEHVMRIVGGGTPSRRNLAYWGGTIPWATVKDLTDFSSDSTQENITTSGLEQSATRLVPAGTVILATRMALGVSAVFDVDVAINQDLKALFPKPDLRPKFLLQLLRYHAQVIQDMGSGSTVKGISMSDLKRLRVFVPPLAIQDDFVQLMTAMEKEITAVERLRSKIKALKQGMMQQLLTGRIRLMQPEVVA